ncbi:glycerophosphocholine cholinephosphodiesterase ENPP6-like [Pecten maximus]|uniref:glycerophosphocholine cholinephosphodiesterase ENPP6-like n=1 Tax=Pecten maximus TaxID=6579 RepID=UPI001458AA6B|nr:glycerophosphocholine cholinephosphodiesterase ENPP6-like [Pecten maximus]
MMAGLRYFKTIHVFHVLLYCVLFGSVAMHAVPKDNKLLLFLLDGFRWDYFDRQEINLPGFRRMMREGARAEYLLPDFPSLSYPNYYSIMTGLHCEDHGMVGNYMFDTKHNESFLIGVNRDQYHAYWWDDGEPLWVTAEKQGKRSYFYSWPGCEVTIRGVDPTYCKKYPMLSYPKLKDMQAAIAEGLELFSNGSADVVGIYVELPDKYGHKYGPSSAKLNQKLEEIDAEMDKLLDELESRDLRDDVNIMIFSDHGMTEVSETRVINITDYVDIEDIRVVLDAGANVYIWPNPGKLDKVYSDLVAMDNPYLTVLKKADIPDRWYYRNHYRTSPILLVAANGWYITTPLLPRFFSYFGSGPMQGTHGFDNNETDMQGIFLATGPDISQNVVVKGFANIHIYQMMCDVLGLTPNQNDGQWDAVAGVLTHKRISSATSVVVNVTMVIVMAVFSLIRLSI